jgi:adenine deaminase
MIITGNLVDIPNRNIYPAQITIQDGRIKTIAPTPQVQTLNPESLNYILPGFVDAHVHIESSMLVPSQFARLSVVHGTVATVSDPHEIANVCGMDGVEFMIKDGKRVPFKFYFGAPSCVPATTFETSGAAISVQDVNNLMSRKEIKYLSEMMNFPGVLTGDKDVLGKIAIAGRYNKPVDGHAPGLMGEDARKYFEAGISTDHECFTEEEALDKLSFGAKILIREGSAARNFEALIDLLHEYYDHMMFCSDDKHPDSLVSGHINQLCARAVAKGIDIFKVLQAACINPVHHYQLDVGLLQEGDAADFIVVKNLEQFEVLQTYINGVLVAGNGKTLIGSEQPADVGEVNNFSCAPKDPHDFAIEISPEAGPLSIPVIEALDGQLITNKLFLPPKIENGQIVSNVAQDVIKIVVVNRYHNTPVAKAFITNFGLKRGAIASSVAHDSHNIVAVGVDDESLCRAVNLVISSKGGVSCVDNEHELLLPLPVAGLMSAEDGYNVAEQYTAIDAAAKALGSTLSSPFMTLSFMALLVIPHLKLSDKGLFDGDKFEII